MRQIRLAARYARALFDFADEKQAREAVFADMQTMISTCSQSHDFQLMLHSPVIKADKKNNVMKALFANRFHPVSMAYLTLITRKRREDILDEIALQYVNLYRSWKGIKVATLQTPVEIDEDQKARFVKLLKDQYKAEIELETIVKPQLLGGFVLEMEGLQYDASIHNKIKKLTREFQVNIYERKM